MPDMQNPFAIILEEIREFRDAFQEFSAQNPDWKKSKTVSDEDRFVTKQEAADYAAVSVSTIANWAREGKIKRYYFGSVVRYHFPELKAYLQNQ